MNVAHETDTMMHKHVDLSIKEIDADKREIKFIASQELNDRDGDLIVVDGIDLSDFRTPRRLPLYGCRRGVRRAQVGG